jgi:putative transposase
LEEIATKEECLSRLILFGKHALRHALKHYQAHYHARRRHQGKGNVVLMPAVNHSQGYDGPIHCREQLSGLLKYDDGEAA